MGAVPRRKGRNANAPGGDTTRQRGAASAAPGVDVEAADAGMPGSAAHRLRRRRASAMHPRYECLGRSTSAAACAGPFNRGDVLVAERIAAAQRGAIEVV